MRGQKPGDPPPLVPGAPAGASVMNHKEGIREFMDKLKFIAKRLLLAVITMFLISFVVFFVIQLPPGDFVDTLVTNMIAEGEKVSEAEIAALRELYGVDRPFLEQYFDWLGGILTGDWGTSFNFNENVLSIILEYLGPTMMLSIVTLIVQYVVSIPIGIYAAKHQYSVGDYALTLMGFIGMAIPHFLFAILLMYISYQLTGTAVMGLFPEGGIVDFASFLDFLKRLIIPIIVIGLGGTCSSIRSTRALMLDEQTRPYVLCTRAKGVKESTLTWKYELRAILNPTVSGLGGIIAGIFNGSTITAIVLLLPTLGPILLQALKTQDVYLSGGILLISATLVVIGTLISDLLLAVLDPRIQYIEETK